MDIADSFPGPIANSFGHHTVEGEIGMSAFWGEIAVRASLRSDAAEPDRRCAKPFSAAAVSGIAVPDGA